ncbi:PLP-dependent aminotransferase family protein [Agromyces bauzanensis]|uniref:GntR family transcriptional regulator n=1 Tax=Agromyces bauzanensis TaxID=1308924 RepID=A0A917PL20_9MICO|nr:PLP-dependent aminotransferase family protein [Agromyces bauzanensis]GGJ83328.1 GntR family transcriptional regulator [Agromyces bauzanensis]
MVSGRVGSRELAAALGAWRSSAPTLADALAESVRAAVLDGRLGVGTVLPSERALAESLRVSRGTLVNALGVLRRGGWMVTRHGSGSELRLPTAVTERITPWTLDHPGGELELDLTHAVTAAPHAAVTAAGRFAAAALPPLLVGDGVTETHDAELRAAIAVRYTAEGMPTEPREILITTGARAALHLILEELHDRRRPILVENPSYHGALALIRARRARTIAIPVTEQGWDLTAIGAASRGAIAYLVPDFHNPTGALMPPEQRLDLATLADRLGITLVIDETMRDLDLRDPPRPIPRIAGSPVVALGTTSKTVWGGIRVGWIRASAPMIRRLQRNPLTGLFTPSPLTQLAARPLVASLDELLVQRRTQLRTQRDHLAAALEAGDAWDFTTPDGGLTIWLRVHGISARTLVDRAHRQGLALAHGTQFAIEGGAIDRIRIPFTAHPEALDRAVAILQNALERPPDGAEEHARPAFGRVGDTGLDTIY